MKLEIPRHKTRLFGNPFLMQGVKFYNEHQEMFDTKMPVKNLQIV